MKKYKSKLTTEQMLINKIMSHWEKQIFSSPQEDKAVNEIIENFAQSCGIVQSKLNGDVFVTVSNMTNRQKRLLYRILVEAKEVQEKDKIALPSEVASILRKLNECGYEAYVVGGCVRDSLLGLVPKDWDICTSAKPDEVKAVFTDEKIIETGVQHGTVMLILGDGQYEITTFRVDGDYEDCRRPASVEFVADLIEDLSRRDFSINAIAYNPSCGIVDPFEGKKCLEMKKLVCVGDRDKRFNEDALRIMRALRFAAVYGFSISPLTADAIHKNKCLLSRVSAERISAELCKLLCGQYSAPVLLQFRDVITTIIPELEPCVDFNQNNKYHCYDVYEHIVRATANMNSDDDVILRLALFLHDIGKPSSYTEDENGNGHFYGHPKRSVEIAGPILKRLKLPTKVQHDVLELIELHDAHIEPTPRVIKRLLGKIGKEQFDRLILHRIADMLAHTPGMYRERIDICLEAKKIADEIVQQEMCFKLSDLAVNGHDIMALGIPEGKSVGVFLHNLLQLVIDGALVNERDALLSYAKLILRSTV